MSYSQKFIVLDSSVIDNFSLGIRESIQNRLEVTFRYLMHVTVVLSHGRSIIFVATIDFCYSEMVTFSERIERLTTFIKELNYTKLNHINCLRERVVMVNYIFLIVINSCDFLQKLPHAVIVKYLA